MCDSLLKGQDPRSEEEPGGVVGGSLREYLLLDMLLESRVHCYSLDVAKTAFPKRCVTGTRRGCCFWPAAAKRSRAM